MQKLVTFLKQYFVYLQWILMAGIAYLYLYIAHSSFGYDDEFFNIRLIRENSMEAIIRIIQSTDVHPPLSYILNKFFYQLTHSWTGVRMISAFLFLVAFFYLLLNTEGKRNRILIFLLIGLNPAIMLWGTSIRWYAYVLPLLLILQVVPQYQKKYYWYYFFGISCIICFLGYIGIFLSLPYFILYYLNDKTDWKQKWKRIVIPASLFLLVYGWQLFLFITVHAKNDSPDSPQTFDIKANLLSFLSATFSNQGLFPVTVLGMVSILGMALVYIYTLCLQWVNIKQNKNLLAFLIASLLFMVLGIAGKLRNLVLLEPTRNLLMIHAVGKKFRMVLFIGITMVVVGNIGGTYHVLTHQRTTKNAWNIPVAKTILFVEKLEQQGVREIYFTHHPTFDYYFTVAKKATVSFYSDMYFHSSWINTKVMDLANSSSAKKMNFTFLVNYRGRSISVEHYQAFMNAMNGVKADSVKRFYLDRDPEYKLRKKYFPDYPEYITEVVKYYGVTGNITPLSVWERNK